MKYRITIITYMNDRKVYVPQVKTGWITWEGINIYGEVMPCELEVDDREIALKRIDLHRERNVKVNTIEFDYIVTTK